MPVFVLAQPLAEAAVRDVVLYDVTIPAWRETISPPSLAPPGCEILGRSKAGSDLCLMIATEGGAAA